MGDDPSGISPALCAWLGVATPKHPGGQRSRRACDTVELLSPILWERFGISRLANVTGLDRIDIPVVMAVRPNSRLLAVSQGKGPDLQTARASALMESVEQWHAEQHQLPTHISSWADLREAAGAGGGLPVLDPRALHLSFESRWHADLPIPWVEGIDVENGASTWVPYELVHTDGRPRTFPGGGCFAKNTNGLASGNTKAEALLAALCELIERDASTLADIAPQGKDSRRIDWASVDDPVAVDLLDRFEAAEMDVMAWDVTSDIAVATFQVVIADRTADPVLRPLPAAYGAGTHPDRGVALVRALTEAAQSRLTAIAGARDDLTRAGYRTTQRAEALAAHAEEARRPGRRAFSAAPTAANPTVDDDVVHVVDALRSRGALPIVVVDLSRDDVPVHAVRVVVGHLEAPMESPSFRAGGRARAHLAQLAHRSEGAA